MANEDQTQTDSKEINEVIEYNECLPIASEDNNKLVKCLGSMSNLRANFLLEIIRTSIYLIVAFGIFVFFEKSNRVTFKEQNFFSSEQVVYLSEIRGLFPPMKGTEIALMGKWRVSFTNSLEIGANDIFNNYTMEFKTNNTLRIKRVACDGDLYMRWETFEYNIHISMYDFDKNDTMIIEPDENDTKCITENSTFFNHIRDATVWTLDEEKLYILIERWHNNRTIQSIVLLDSN